jgi:ATP-binding cassette subfamily B protein
MQSKINLLSFVWQFIRRQPVSFLIIFLFSLGWTLDSLTWSYLMRIVIDTLTQYDTNRTAIWGALKWVIIAGVSLWIFVELLFRTRDYIRSKAIPKLEAEMRMAMFNHIQHHSPKYFNEHFAGSLANKISDMVTQVTSMIMTLNIFIPAIASSILVLVLFSQVNPLFALILGSWMVLHFGVCAFFTKKCVETSNIHGEARSTLAGKIVDSLTNNFAVNLFYRFGYEYERVGVNQKIEQTRNSQAMFVVFQMLLAMSVLFIIMIVSINGFLLLTWTQNKITTGEVVQVFYTTFNVVMILWISGDLLPQFFRSYGVATQALTVMNDPQDVVDVPQAAELIVRKGEIVFDRVSFKYSDAPLFENKNVVIRGGEKVGLVGYSGAGKSTFVKLILRFYPLESGRILIDDQDIAHVTLRSLHEQVALIPQDPLLFHRSLEDNIHYGNLEATKEEVIQAAQMAQCDEFIRKTPKGYESKVGERGTKLSGGERQRIAIARAILADAPILILDEATSSLDSVTERYIQDSLESLMQDRTTIVIAHRLSTLAKMDRILVFDEGAIVEEGTHTELLEKNGQYAKMWKMQVGGFLPITPN